MIGCKILKPPKRLNLQRRSDHACCLLDHSVPSYATEFEDTRKSVLAVSARAQYNLGFMYAVGAGVPENDKTAVMWYTKAAEQGDARAQYNLGLMYHNGDGVPESDIKAYVW